VKEGVSVFAVQPAGCLVVVRNVYCYECAQCGEVEFADEVMVVFEHIIEGY